MLLKEIECIDKMGINLLTQEDELNLIDELIELPLRSACKIFKQKGIETVMSSANKNNILSSRVMPTEKEHIIGMQYFYPAPTFLDAGKGYSWIMLNFDTLSDDNKELVFTLEDKIGEKNIWFVHPFSLGNLDYKIKVGEYTYSQLRELLPEDELPEGIEYDEYLAKFESKHIVLGYNNRYPINTVFLRMPVNENTTVEEVQLYFTNLANMFNNQLSKEILSSRKYQ